MKRPLSMLVPRLAAAALLASVASFLPAATYLPLGDPELAGRSPVIVRARVTSARVGLDRTPDGVYPFTTVSLTRIETFKGRVRPVFRVRLPGGRAGEVARSIPGAPQFSAGQEVVLFLAPLPGRPDEYRLTEFGLSKFDIVSDSRGERFAVRPVFDAREDDAVSGRPRPLSIEATLRAPLRRRADSFFAALRDAGAPSRWPVEYAEPFIPDRASGKRPSWVNIGGTEGGSLFRWFWDTGTSPNAIVTTSGVQANLSDGSNGEAHAQNAVDRWRGVSGADVRYGGLARSGNVVIHLGATSSFDGGTTWDTPLPCRSGGIIGLGGPGSSRGPRTFKGESPYFAPSSGTVSMRQRTGPAGCYSAALFRSAVLHELGHTLGLGHSDQGASVHSANSQGSAAAATAVMHSVIPDGLPDSPQPDDIQAIQYYYGAAAVAAPLASFAAPSSGVAGQRVGFADTSTGSPTSWSWSFGDGSNSADRNPAHVYSTAGTYSVTLTATNSGGSSQASHSIRIASAPPPGATVAATLPVAGHAAGEGGTVFVTDVVIENPSPSFVAADLLFFPVGGGAPSRLPIALSALESLALPDVVASGFGVTNSFGALRLEVSGSPAPFPRMTSRTYDEVGGGSFGMAVSGVVDRGASAATRIVTGLERSAACRSSIGAVNSSATDSTFAVTLRAADGTIVGASAPVRLPPGGQWQSQLADLFPGASGEGLTAEFASVDGSRVPFAYGTLVDNLSGDPTYYPSLTPATRLTLPVLSRVTGVGGALFVSRVALSNPSNLPASATLTFRERDRDNRFGSPAISVALAPWQTRSIEDALGLLFGLSETYGSLEISSTSPVVAAARISTASATTPGSVGQQVDPVSADEFYSRASILGLRQDASFRSNVGFVNPNDFALRIALVLRRPDGSALATTTVAIPPRGLVQSGLPALFAGAAFPAAVPLTLALDSGGPPFAAYAIVADNVSGDLTASPAIP